MEKQLSPEKIKYLIKKYDMKLVSLEFKIPMETLMKYQQELLEETRKKNRTISSSNKTSYLKMQQMRGKYRELFANSATSNNTTNNNTKTNTIEELSMQQLKEAETLISQIEQKAGGIINVSKLKKREIAISIIEDIKTLQQYQPLPLHLAQRFQVAIGSVDISSMPKDNSLASALHKAKRIGADKLVKAISIEVGRTENIEKLEELCKKLTTEIEKTNKMAVSSLRSSIQKKISDLKQRDIRTRLNSVPENISGIIASLLNGEIDIEEANKVIIDEAKNRVASRPKTQFSVTEEQEVRQIGIQIRTAIMNNPGKYNITNPDSAINQLQQLCGIEQGEAVRTVVTNLIGKKHYEIAKMICRKFSGEDYQGTLPIYIRRLHEDIRNAEISDLVLRGLNMNGTPEELASYFGVIEMGLQKGNINTRAVSLGKSRDGLKEITLYDIWPGSEKEANNRGTH